MAIQTYYISIRISEEDKLRVASIANLKRYKKNGDLIFRDVLWIDNISAGESWWHINVGLYDFFHNCEILYEFCKIIDTLKPRFSFYLKNQEYEFSFQSFLEFLQFIYPRVEVNKRNFEECYGVLSISPKQFFSFRRKNRRHFK